MDFKTALSMLKNTLQSMEIKGTQENCDKLLGCYMLIDNMAKALDTAKTEKEGGKQKMTVTVKGKTFLVDWCWLVNRTEQLMLEYTDARHVSEIATDWEGAEVIERKSETEGNITYEGFTSITRIIRKENGKVEIALVKG